MAAEMILANPPRGKGGKFVKGGAKSGQTPKSSGRKKTAYKAAKRTGGGGGAKRRGFVLIPPVKMVAGLGGGFIAARMVTDKLAKGSKTADDFGAKMATPTYARAGVKAGIGIVGGGLVSRFDSSIGLGFVAGAMTDGLIDAFLAWKAGQQTTDGMGEEVTIIEGDGLGEEYVIEGEAPLAGLGEDGYDDDRYLPSTIGEDQAVAI